MARLSLQGSRVLFWTAMALSMGLVTQREVQAWAEDIAAQVELDCKVTPSFSDDRKTSWIIELRKPSGEPVRSVTSIGGGTLHLKNLDPGIYTICIQGTGARERCESVDLNPPSGKKFYRFSKMFQAPLHVLNVADLHRVTRLKLSTPLRAREELFRAKQAQLRGDTKQAVQHLERAIEIDPSYSDALNNLGTYYHRAGKYDQSIRYFRKVTELDPDFYGGWVNLGGSLLAVGKFQDALEANQHAYNLRPSDTAVISQIALNYYYLHDLSEAGKYFRRVLALDPGSAVSPHLYLAHIALAEKKQAEAAEYVKKYLEIHPNAPEAPHLRETLDALASESFFEPAQVAQTKR